VLRWLRGRCRVLLAFALLLGCLGPGLRLVLLGARRLRRRTLLVRLLVLRDGRIDHPLEHRLQVLRIGRRQLLARLFGLRALLPLGRGGGAGPPAARRASAPTRGSLLALVLEERVDFRGFFETAEKEHR